MYLECVPRVVLGPHIRGVRKTPSKSMELFREVPSYVFDRRLNTPLATKTRMSSWTFLKSVMECVIDTFER